MFTEERSHSCTMFHLIAVLHFATLTLATIAISDPSDVISPAAWAADNAILADYNVSPIMYQFIPTVGPYSFSGENTTLSHQSLSVDANDTSVIVVSNKSDVTVEYSTIIKYGYGSNLLQSSFFGK